MNGTPGKPENIFITTDGQVKILDFGLAQFEEPDADATGGSPTEFADVDFTTRPGTVIGTAP